MSLERIDFSDARPLEGMYGKGSIEYYDYKNSDRTTLFSSIEKYFNITAVREINNPQLYGMYLLWKEELQISDIYSSGDAVEERTLYHVTSPQNATSIALGNIDWRYTRRSRFGKGACFSICPKYANKYAGSKGAFVIFKVLVKNVQRVDLPNYYFEVPTENKFDTTFGNGGDVVVKYDDNQYYPEFIVYYTDYPTLMVRLGLDK